ncbi:MAG TPA: hypothetical protein VMK16_09050, partial [Acidimicrobiales bacterium]|nr:hypothetical protein [Acidimicrobiales bacterium]
ISNNNGPGVLVRDSNDADVEANLITGNCAGMFVLSTYADTSAVSARMNVVTANNRFCPAGVDGYPSFSGIGIGVAGAPDADVNANLVSGNHASQPADLPSGDIVRLDG